MLWCCVILWGLQTHAQFQDDENRCYYTAFSCKFLGLVDCAGLHEVPVTSAKNTMKTHIAGRKKCKPVLSGKGSQWPSQRFCEQMKNGLVHSLVTSCHLEYFIKLLNVILHLNLFSFLLWFAFWKKNHWSFLGAMETVLMSEMFSVGAWKREADGCSYWWALLAVGAVECSAELLSWLCLGWVRLAARRKSLCRGIELSPGAAVTLCPVVSPRAQPHHMAALAAVHASSGASFADLHRITLPVQLWVFFCPRKWWGIFLVLMLSWSL